MAELSQLDGITPSGYLSVSSQDVIDCTRQLAKEEGIFAGFSSGANLAAALQLLAGPLPGATVAVITGDSGLKYLSTDLWTWGLRALWPCEEWHILTCLLTASFYNFFISD